MDMGSMRPHKDHPPVSKYHISLQQTCELKCDEKCIEEEPFINADIHIFVLHRQVRMWNVKICKAWIISAGRAELGG